MHRRPLTLTVLAGLAIAMTAPCTLRAQIGTPPKVTGPIRSARRVAAATNTHIAREQAPTTADTGSAKRKAVTPPASGIGHQASGEASTKSSDARRPTPEAPRSAVPGPEARDPDPTLVRESFTYSADGRRDPFVSLMASGELRPMISDLKLAAIIYDPTGHSVAVLRDLSTNEQYRVTVGKTLGRMRVTAIQPKSVTFVLEEFGYSRKEVLALNDSTTERAQ